MPWHVYIGFIGGALLAGGLVGRSWKMTVIGVALSAAAVALPLVLA